jgi:hypothetical protein
LNIAAPSTTAVTLPPIPEIKSAKQEEFERFHKQHPEIYKKLVELARVAKHFGKGTYSINALFEQVRWFYLTKRDYPFKLNNNWRSLYARKIMATEKDLRGFFETRTLTTY